MWWPPTPRPHQVRRPLQPLASRPFRSSEAGGTRPDLTDESASPAALQRARNRSTLPSGGTPAGRAQRTLGGRSRAPRPALKLPACGGTGDQRERCVRTVSASNFHHLLPHFLRPIGWSSAALDASPGSPRFTAGGAASYPLTHPMMLLYLLVETILNYHMNYQQTAHHQSMEASDTATCVSARQRIPMRMQVVTVKRRLPRSLKQKRTIYLHLAHSDAHRTATQRGQRQAMR